MDKLRMDIIATATVLFKKYGLRSISIDDVCKELRISKKTFYNFFKQKEELIIQVLINMHEETRKKTKQPWEYDKDKNIIDIIMESDKQLKSTAENEKKNFTMYFDLEKYYPKIFQGQVEAIKSYNQGLMKEFIERGISEDVFRDDLDIELMALYITSQFQSMMQLVREKKREHSQLFKFLRDIIIRILANEKGMIYYVTKYVNKNRVEKS